MPQITVEGPEITDLEKRRSLVRALTDAAAKAYGLSRRAITVLLKVNRPDHVAIGGELLSDRQASESPPA